MVDGSSRRTGSGNRRAALRVAGRFAHPWKFVGLLTVAFVVVVAALVIAVRNARYARAFARGSSHSSLVLGNVGTMIAPDGTPDPRVLLAQNRSAAHREDDYQRNVFLAESEEAPFIAQHRQGGSMFVWMSTIPALAPGERVSVRRHSNAGAGLQVVSYPTRTR